MGILEMKLATSTLALFPIIYSHGIPNSKLRRWGNDPKTIVRCASPRSGSNTCQPENSSFEPRMVGSPESYQPLLNANYWPNYYDDAKDLLIPGQVNPLNSEKVKLSDAQFSDDDQSRCPDGVAATWEARFAIDGVKYCTNDESCNSEYRLAHSKEPVANFTAEIDLNYRNIDIGRVMWWPREDCCQNHNENVAVFIGDDQTGWTQCKALTEFHKTKFSYVSTSQSNVAEVTRKGTPFVFKCPIGTRGKQVRFWNDNFAMITELEVWTRDDGVSKTEIDTSNLNKITEFRSLYVNDPWYTGYRNTDRSTHPLLDGDLTTSLKPQGGYTGSYQIKATFKSKKTVKQVHVYPKGMNMGLVKVTVRHDIECVTDTRFEDEQRYQTNHVLQSPEIYNCENNCNSSMEKKRANFCYCRRSEDVSKVLIEKKLPVVYVCPEGAEGNGVTIKPGPSGRTLDIAELKIFE